MSATSNPTPTPTSTRHQLTLTSTQIKSISKRHSHHCKPCCRLAMEPETIEGEEMPRISNELSSLDDIDSYAERNTGPSHNQTLSVPAAPDHSGTRNIPMPLPSTPATASALMSHVIPSGALVITEGIAATAPGSGESVREAPRQPPRKPVAKKRKAGTGRGRAVQGVRGGNGFTQNETESLLELLQEHLPLAKEEWEKVARLHELRYPQQNRNTECIRRKFSALCRTLPPTGDPSIPPDVLKAKDIRREMTERADIGNGEVSDDEYTEGMNDSAPFPRPGTPGTPATSGSVASLMPDSSHDLTGEPQVPS